MIPNGFLRYSQKYVIQGGMTSSPAAFAKADQRRCTPRSAPGSADHHTHTQLALGEPQGPSHAGGKLGYIAGLISPNHSHQRTRVRHRAGGCWGAMVPPWPGGNISPAFPSKASFPPPVEALALGCLQSRRGGHSPFPAAGEDVAYLSILLRAWGRAAGDRTASKPSVYDVGFSARSFGEMPKRLAK